MSNTQREVAMRVQRVLMPGTGFESWTVLGEDLIPVESVERFLSYLASIEKSPNTIDLEERLVAEGEIAGDYLEELLDLLDFDGDIDLDVEGDRAIVSIDGGQDLNKLVGRRGEVLDALQELTRLAVHQKTGERSRLMLDIANWRRRRREELTALGDKVARRVLASGDREELAPMTPFERKIVHDAVAAVDGVESESEGAEPKRRVVVIKA